MRTSLPLPDLPTRKGKRERERMLKYPKLEHTFHSPRKPHNMWGANRPGGLTRPLCPGEEEENAKGSSVVYPAASASSVCEDQRPLGRTRAGGVHPCLSLVCVEKRENARDASVMQRASVIGLCCVAAFLSCRKLSTQFVHVCQLKKQPDSMCSNVDSGSDGSRSLV